MPVYPQWKLAANRQISGSVIGPAWCPPCPVLSLRSPLRRHQILERLPAADDAPFVSLHQIQTGCLGIIVDAFFRPAAPEQDERLLLVVADVAGKSVPAALLMATLQASLRTLAALPGSLLELVGRLNQYACAQNLGGRRFTHGVPGGAGARHRTPDLCERGA